MTPMQSVAINIACVDDNVFDAARPKLIGLHSTDADAAVVVDVDDVDAA